MTYTTADILKATGLTRARLHQLRAGYTKDIYTYKPILIEGTDYYWEKGAVIYKESAIDKLNCRKTRVKKE